MCALFTFLAPSNLCRWDLFGSGQPRAPKKPDLELVDQIPNYEWAEQMMLWDSNAKLLSAFPAAAVATADG